MEHQLERPLALLLGTGRSCRDTFSGPSKTTARIILGESAAMPEVCTLTGRYQDANNAGTRDASTGAVWSPGPESTAIRVQGSLNGIRRCVAHSRIHAMRWLSTICWSIHTIRALTAVGSAARPELACSVRSARSATDANGREPATRRLRVRTGQASPSTGPSHIAVAAAHSVHTYVHTYRDDGCDWQYWQHWQYAQERVQLPWVVIRCNNRKQSHSRFPLRNSPFQCWRRRS